MPVLKTSSYQPPLLYLNRHVNTIAHALLRIPKIVYKRERLKTEDDDFVDLDFSKKESNTVVLIIHGLEGNSKSGYVKGIARACNENEWDAVVLNFRGCSGEENKSFGSYHSGQTEDVELAVEYLKNKHHYDTVFLVSYSLGANVMLKYLGDTSIKKSNIKASVAISAPCDLAGCAIQLEKWYNKAYMITFLRSLRKKVKAKCKAHPNHNINLKSALKANTFMDFDNEFTAPANGFKDALDYWKRSSSTRFLSNIEIPTLLINAQDDPFLTPSCFPFKEAASSKYFHLETPKKGGHVGFVSNLLFRGNFWHEKRIIQFLDSI